MTWIRHIGISAKRCRSTALGDEVGVLWPLADYAFTVAFRDGLEAAMPLLEDGIDRARAIGADAPRVYMESLIGHFMIMVGRAAQARRHLEPCSRPQSPVERFRHWASLFLALSDATLGDLDRAGAGVDEPLAYARATGERMTLGVGLWLLTHLRLAEGRLAEARTSAAELETVVLDLGRLNWWASVTDSVAQVAIADGDSHAAIRLCEEAILLMRPLAPELLACFYTTKGEALASIGDLGGAAKGSCGCGRPDSLARSSVRRVRALVTLAHIERREGRADDAEDHAHEVLRLGRPMGHRRGVVDALEVLGMCAVDAELWRGRPPPRGHGRLKTGNGLPVPLASGAGSARRERRRARCRVECRGARPSVGGRGRALLGRRVRVRGARPGQAQAAGDRMGGPDRDRGQGRGARRRRVDERPGRRAFISRHTVDSHLRHIYAKLGVSTRAELATRVARQDGADV